MKRPPKHPLSRQSLLFFTSHICRLPFHLRLPLKNFFKILLLSYFLFSHMLIADDALNETQKKLQKEVEHSLVAPCCWNMTVDHHDSQASRQVRTKITEMIPQGKTGNEILAYFTSQPQYGERILAKPSKEGFFGKFAFWILPLALVFAAIVVAKRIKRLTQAQTFKPKNRKKQTPVKNGGDWQQKVEEELKNFDE